MYPLHGDDGAILNGSPVEVGGHPSRRTREKLLGKVVHATLVGHLGLLAPLEGPHQLQADDLRDHRLSPMLVSLSRAGSIRRTSEASTFSTVLHRQVALNMTVKGHLNLLSLGTRDGRPLVPTTKGSMGSQANSSK